VAKKRRRRTTRGRGKMRVGDCRQTKHGQTYCKFPYGVRFVAAGMGDLGIPAVTSDLFLAGTKGGLSGRKRGKMREGQCRRTRNGVKYCKRRGKVKFVRG